MPEIIQGLWIGDALSKMERLSIKSFLSCGHEYHLYVYARPSGVPEGVVLKDANIIIQRDRVFRNANYDTFAAFSDFFRYKLLLDNGGWWADLDMVCLKTFDFSDELVFSSQHRKSGATYANVGALKVPKGSQLASYAWQVCNSKDISHLAWDEIGPRLINECIDHFGAGSYVRSPITFCPISFWDWRRILDPEWQPNFTDSTYAIHLWGELWRRGGVNKNATYDSRCLFEKMKARYSVE